MPRANRYYLYIKKPLTSYMVHLGHEKQVLSDDTTVILE